MDAESRRACIDSILMPPPPKRMRGDDERGTRITATRMLLRKNVEFSMPPALDDDDDDDKEQSLLTSETNSAVALDSSTSGVFTGVLHGDEEEDGSTRRLAVRGSRASSLPDTINFVTPSKTSEQAYSSDAGNNRISAPQDFSETDSLQSDHSTVIGETASSENSENQGENHHPTRQEEAAMPETTNARFSDIIGHASVKLRIDEMLLPLALPPALANSILTGVRSLPASLLLYGPPGCGKTQLARAVAGEARAAFISVGPSDILSKFVGESEASVRSIFRKAYDDAKKMESQCSVLFFDEIDALGHARGPNEMGGAQSSQTDACSRRVLAELLIQLTSLTSPSSDKENNAYTSNAPESDHAAFGDDETYAVARQVSQSQSDDGSWHRPTSKVHVIVVAATNRPEDCDPALLRRFAIRANVDIPTKRDRRKIISKFLSELDHTISEAHLNALAEETEGWSGSDLESLTREAAMAPIRECLRSAAMLKRRARKMEQQGGDDSGQGEKQKTQVDAQEQARDALMRDFRQLRPVTLADFHDAVEFWLGNQQQSATPSLSGSIPQKRKHVHYDSESSSDGEED